MTGRACLFSILHLFAALILGTGSSAGQDSASLRLTLEEAQARASEASNRLAEAQDREGAAQSAVAAQRAAHGPLVSVQARLAREDLTALVRRVEAAEQQRSVARAGGRPVVAITGGVD